MMVRALGSAVQQPAINAMLPDMVPTEHLTRVNGINGSLNSLITLISPMLSGALMGFAPLQYIFFIDVITAAAAICVMLFLFKLPQQAEKPKPAPGAYFAEMKEGFSYILKLPYLRTFFGFVIAFYVFIGPVSFLTPLQVTRNYGGDVWRLTAIEVVFSVGMLLGGLLISAWGGFKNRVHTIALSALVMSAGTMALGIPLPFWFYIVVMGLVGLIMPIFNTPAVVLLQERVDPNYLGRVFSIMTMLSSSIMPLAMLGYGPLADLIPIEYLLVPTGAVMLVLSLFILRNRTLLAAGGQLPTAAPEG